ncbi:hypothetical protein PI125_g17284 [Phytophthora idaei]|nr:hypothetical protein PI125_g17284 [Phytophthora idaei]
MAIGNAPVGEYSFDVNLDLTVTEQPTGIPNEFSDVSFASTFLFVQPRRLGFGVEGSVARSAPSPAADIVEQA